MFNFHLSNKKLVNKLIANNRVPVNLLQQPIERASLLVLLIAFAQFMTYNPGPVQGPAFSWFLTAPALMISAILVAIRSKNSAPLLLAFVSGASALLFYFNPDMAFIGKWLFSFSSGFEVGNKNWLVLSLYTLMFWIIISQFVKSRYFITLQQWVLPSDREYDETLSTQFEFFMFMMTLVVLNTALFFSLKNIDPMSVMTISLAGIYLFVSGEHFSAQKRGILLPMYLTLLVIASLLMQSQGNYLFSSYDAQILTLEPNLMVFILEVFLLWLGHHFLSPVYNKVFSEKQIDTAIWPWFGLFILVMFLFEASLILLLEPLYLIILLAYLLLMLRNTSLSVISWSFILLLSWLVLVVLSPVNDYLFSNTVIPQFDGYNQLTLMFCFALITFHILWERLLNPMLSHLGWHLISFEKPAIQVSLVITIISFVSNILLVAGLYSGWFDLMPKEALIEINTLMMIALFITVSYFMNTQWLAHLTHASLIFFFLLIWRVNEIVPVYTLLSAIFLLWVLLPSMLKKFGERFTLVNPEQFVRASVSWVYLLFATAIVTLLAFTEDSKLGIEHFSFLSSIAVLLFGTIQLSKRDINGLWTVLSYFLAMGLLVSLRFMLLGSVAVNAYDTAGILVVSLVLLGLNRMGLLTSPVINSNIVVQILPLTALLTIPWQVGSLHSSVTLLLLGIFYLLNKKENHASLYTGVVLINLSVYLWMPLLSDHTSLMLFYVMPISMSLLLILHLHKNEITVDLQNKIRFIALSALYLVVTADVFISSSLLLFFVGLLIGLLSAVYGISSKTKAFLYTGIGFIIINILGQLVVFYPDDRLGRALILMSTGAVITGLMVWFNIKREMLLSKIRIFRADLDHWE